MSVVFAAALTGCYSYIPAELGSVQPRERVLVHLTRQGWADIPELPGQTDNSVNGTVTSRSATRLVVRVPLIPAGGAGGSESFGQDVDIPLPEIIDVRRRRLDPVRTGLLVAAGVGGAVAALYSFNRPGSGGQGGPPQEESLRVPLGSGGR